ncbi:gluconokinase [Frateuria aurantia]|uniref:Gluconokinase n=1 Tax=Frateuria aurantia (strain ATCC 33424 / DSM 6220 / KCTC 2777 / LMG 1558 / NBRC 3245 / NCIMB 13370) TaxID=767434 RepID=H8L3Q0_FRAAD|nr:gluconokinase [Frateuria aurantia]AFC87419.1 carbohydrate kinase, thermoresistant glucokinase family [Frateuria aurantia DSM 6220]
MQSQSPTMCPPGVPPVAGEVTVWIVMGVSGSGKSTVGQALAEALTLPFCEGDSLHPAANIAKMAAGHPLTDADRWPWLDLIGDWIRTRLRQGEGGVVSCSALRRVYRDRLRQAGARVRFVYLDIPRQVLQQRLQARHHFMPASLLDSQLQTLEPPTADEAPVVVRGDLDLLATVELALRQIRDGA